MADDAPDNQSLRRRRNVRFGEGVVESTSADEAANAHLWRGARRILVPALVGAAYAAYRVFTST
jgi:hypothetical protein